eukprot:TRINITY_DN10964_c0_g1_i2.p2 TRINITY_DN10964_c0_g1~~TRINITY_DN10964_c0_g1_i2.p2  ORF type:complete len:139 (-),score=23.26 TRINITY_DN10964_c0_g1_i2:280-696(-)
MCIRDRYNTSYEEFKQQFDMQFECYTLQMLDPFTKEKLYIRNKLEYDLAIKRILNWPDKMQNLYTIQCIINYIWPQYFDVQCQRCNMNFFNAQIYPEQLQSGYFCDMCKQILIQQQMMKSTPRPNQNMGNNIKFLTQN